MENAVSEERAHTPAEIEALANFRNVLDEMHLTEEYAWATRDAAEEQGRLNTKTQVETAVADAFAELRVKGKGKISEVKRDETDVNDERATPAAGAGASSSPGRINLPNLPPIRAMLPGSAFTGTEPENVSYSCRSRTRPLLNHRSQATTNKLILRHGTFSEHVLLASTNTDATQGADDETYSQVQTARLLRLVG